MLAFKKPERWKGEAWVRVWGAGWEEAHCRAGHVPVSDCV